MGINDRMTHDQVIAKMKAVDAEIDAIGARVAVFANDCRIIGASAKKCHDSLKAFNDTFFPSIGISV